MPQQLVICTLPLSETQQTRLCAGAPQYRFCFLEAAQIPPQTLAEAAVVIGNLTYDQLAQAQALRWLQLISAGYEYYLGPDGLPPGVLLTNAVGAYGQTVSDHMLALVIALQRNLHLYRDQQNARRWQSAGPVRPIAGNRVLVAGLGDISGQFAQKMHALGNRVYGVKRNVISCPAYLESVHTLDDLDELLPSMDIVALCLPGGPETTGLFDKARLFRLKRGALLINVGRGSVLDQAALCEALEDHLGGAAIDVTTPEPLPAEDPLWQQPNLILTPHVAGGFWLPQTLENVLAITLENLQRFARGETLRNLVEIPRG